MALRGFLRRVAERNERTAPNADRRLPRSRRSADRYADTAPGPVQYVLVANDDGVLGYLWACDESGAAGYEHRRSAADVAVAVTAFWRRKLRGPKAVGLPPSQAIAKLTAEPPQPTTGRIVAGSAGVAPSVAVLVELAAG